MAVVQSLRDKLIKAGLITEAKSRPEEKKPARSADPAPRTAERSIPPLPPLALPGSKAHQRLTALQQLELDKRLRALVVASQVPIEPGGCAFHFVTRKGRVRRLELSETQVKQLEAGALAIVERPDPAQIEHALVPQTTADQMVPLSEKSVRFYNRKGSPIGFTPADEEVSGGEVPNAQ
jgi:uncharacterized protein YaiL (DUF2058 family)